MSKRPWTDDSEIAGTPYGRQPANPRSQQQPSLGDQQTLSSLVAGDTVNVEAGAVGKERTPQLSRKIKACASCRKHKIKCVIEDSGPPCRRCTKHGLECIISRNLQTIIDEKTRYTEAIFRDLENMHTVIRQLARKQGISEPSVLHTSALRGLGGSLVQPESADSAVHVDSDVDDCPVQSSSHRDDEDLSRDASPDVSPQDDAHLPNVPIHSLYELTKLRALRFPEDASSGPQKEGVDDFIARGVVKLEDAGRLFLLYRNRLDGFMFSAGCPYHTLEELRVKSPVLTAAILTVSALHDPQADSIYGICSSEFRQLIERSIFSRNVNRDYLRALCVASYWLSDMSWMLSGYAIRRAFEYELHNQMHRAIKEQHNAEAADGCRLWFILHISDQRLATLYGRPAIVHEYPSIDEIETYLETPVSNAQDRRLMGQVSLLSIFKDIRELFGPDRGRPVPRAYLPQIAQLNRQLDQWFDHWSLVVSEEYELIGRFPRKAARLHFYFAKLHLYSHIFRGLSSQEPIPHYFLDCINAAISAAMSNVDLILNDPDVASVVVGMPSYLHCMTAFACMFLIKVAHKYGKDLIEPGLIWNLTTRLVGVFRSVSAGKWHLTQLMTPRLERLALVLNPINAVESQAAAQSRGLRSGASIRNPDFGAHSADTLVDPAIGAGAGGYEPPMVEFQVDQFFDYNMNFGIPGLSPFGTTAPDLNLQF